MAIRAKSQGKAGGNGKAEATGVAVSEKTGAMDSIAAAETAEQQLRTTVFEIFRRWGYLQAQLDPLKQYLPPEPFPVELPEGSDAIAAEARGFYCGTIALEFSHIASPERREWLQAAMEQDDRETPEQQARTLTQLIRADLFEQTIQQRYLGTKRFSLEGLTALVPYLDRTFQVSAGLGVERCTFAMSHRGRLNVMVNTVGRSAVEIFTKFEDVDPRSHMGGGDVKYHQGATGRYTSPSGQVVKLHLASNPSHLEAVDPVIMGRARARQVRLGSDGPSKVLPLIIHGDAAFAGQGIWAETLDLATLPGYQVGGTIQVVVNNLLGFTAEPHESNSSRYSTDIAKRLPIPIFHVNAEDPDAVVRVAKIAAEYRAKFASDVVVDLVGYRRHGHSEVDDPTVTQPRRYARIKETAPLYKSYAERIGVDASAEAAAIGKEFLEEQSHSREAEHAPVLSELPEYWKPYLGGRLPKGDDVQTGLSAEEVRALVGRLTAEPDGFHVHPKVKALLKQRDEMGAGTRPFDYGTAELVAYASLLKAGMPVRLSGQDTQRGTFNQRHAVWVDTETELRYSPLQHISQDAEKGQGRFEVYNSMLSEAGVLGFEYGYSRDYPEALVLWEAQFGDFANGAQIIIDQFIAAGEAKWGLQSGVVLLLPHGYEGQGPEHSSARIERYLQLCATDNMIVAQPSNAAQYFHLLRRQALSKYRKPLIVFTPKSMLRHPDAVSPVADFAASNFRKVLPDAEAREPRRILVCSGKIGHNLRVERAKRGDFSTAIVFVEQLYPWPAAELEAALSRYPTAQEIMWVQEEPANMGALSYAYPLLKLAAGGKRVLKVTRSAAASPATGSAKAHEMEEKSLIELALGKAAPRTI